MATGQSSSESNASNPVRLEATQGHPSFWGRLLLGLTLSQGLYYGFRQLSLALLHGIGENPEWFATSTGFLVLTGMQISTLLLAAMVAASGVPRGAFLGLLLGILNVTMVLGVEWYTRGMPALIVLYSEPALHLR